MKIAIIGTGKVGRLLAARFTERGHDIVIGTRDVERTLSRTEPDRLGFPPYAEWQEANPTVRLLPFPEAGAHGEVIINATAGAVSLEALETVGAENLAGKVLVDLALPLDFSQGMPPQLLVANTDSLAEQIQRTFPDARVVKTLNTTFVTVMVEPTRLPGRHNLFLSGDDSDAKETARGLLHDFGWPEDAIIDLGGIRTARAVEMYMALYFTLADVLGTFELNIAVVRAE